MIEVSVLTAAVVAALIGMQVYMKRSVSGRWRGAAEFIGQKYAPGRTKSKFDQRSTGTTTVSSKLIPNQPFTDEAGSTTVDITETTGTMSPSDPETTTRHGEQQVDPLGTKLWE